MHLAIRGIQEHYRIVELSIGIFFNKATLDPCAEFLRNSEDPFECAHLVLNSFYGIDTLRNLFTKKCGLICVFVFVSKQCHLSKNNNVDLLRLIYESKQLFCLDNSLKFLAKNRFKLDLNYCDADFFEKTIELVGVTFVKHFN